VRGRRYSGGAGIIATIQAMIVLLIICALLYFPVIKPNIERQNTIKSKIEQNIVDSSYGDVSEFSTPSNCYDQCKAFDGKIVSFTGIVGDVREAYENGEYGESVISIDSEITGEWCADCGINDVTEEELMKMFSEGDKVTVVGEVYHCLTVIELRNCKIELCDDVVKNEYETTTIG